VTDPGRPALFVDRLEAVVFDTDGVLTDTASVHAAAWRRLFDEYLMRRVSQRHEPFWAFTEADYLRHVDGRSRAHLRDHGAQAFPTSARSCADCGSAGRGGRGRPGRGGGQPPRPVRSGRRGADVVVADLGELALQAGPVRRGNR
jgi:hypothetical protein